MYAVERLGNYITRGVYTVSGPFHPFGGAVDIIVVEQPDGSFKTSPWYVRFGKFQGVLKTKEKVVNICVNGVEADFHMYLDHKGEAYFLKEVEVEEGEPGLYQFSSGDDTDGQSNDRRPVKSKSCNYDAREPISGGQIDVENVKILARTGSRRARLLGLVFGRKSKREDNCKEEGGGVDMARASSLECAEIAADLLDVKWSTNLATRRPGKDKASRLSGADLVDCKVDEGLQIDGEQSQVTQTVQEVIENYMDQPELHDGTGFCGRGKNRDCEPGFQESECFSDETCTQVPFAPNEAFKTSTLGGRNAEEQVEVISALSIDTSKASAGNAEFVEHVEVISALSIDTSKASAGNAEFVEHAKLSDEREILLCHGESDVTDMDRVQPFVCGETPEGSKLGLHSFDGQTRETLYLSHGESEGVHVHPEILHQAIEGVHLTTSKSVETEVVGVIHQETFMKRDADSTDTEVLEVPGDHSWRTNSSTSCAIEDMEFNEAATVPESCTPTVKNELKICPVNEAKNNVTDENDGQGLNISSSESSEEEQFLFSDFDDLKLSAVQCTESISPDIVGKIDLPSLTLVGTEAVNEYSGSSSSSDNCVLENLPNDVEESVEKPRQISIPIDILGSHEIGGKRLERMVESLPDLWSHVDDLGAHDLRHPCHSLDLDTKSSNWALLRKNASICIKLDMEEQHQLAEGQLTIGDNQTSGELFNVTFNPAVGDPSEAIVASSGSWRMWPFLKRARTLDAVQPGLNGTRSSDVENAPESTTGMGRDKTELKPKPTKKKVRLITPTSEQLASLNLKEGRNTVTFTFSTAMLGKQQVDCRIYLWKWNTRIVISDVDGTITKSDVLGQFMPWVGVDWSQTGVTHLFSAIKENGYQLLFLSARAISQAYLTRQFLFNLKQDGIALPDGPVVISPDGLFPSLFREVIRRAPHEFKIACLEDIKVLFPSDCSPFYAGFGNRDTDEISYRKVGIPKGKIFTINPKGEVAVNRRVDRKSYPSLHALVHDMFPPKSSTEQEDYNSWNFWKLPPSLPHDG